MDVTTASERIGAGNTSALPVDPHQYLREKEDEEALELLPALVYMGLLAVVGDVGNLVALVVYYKRFSPSSTRTYILAMSALDITFNTLSLPGEILDLRFSLTFDQPSLCRAHRFNNVFLTVTSAFVLVAVACDRRQKICHPFRQHQTSRRALLYVLGCMAVSTLISVPFSVINGRHSVETEIPGVTGAACSIDDQFLDTVYPLLYNLLLVLVFLLCVGFMVTSYVQIGRKIVRHRRKSASLHGAMVTTLHLVDRLESSREVSGEGDAPLSPVDDDNDDVFLRESDSVSTSSGIAKRQHLAKKLKAKAKASSSNHMNQKAGNKHTPATINPEVKQELSSLLEKFEEDKKNTTNRQMCRTDSQAKREKDFEAAVQTLAHTLSEDTLSSSGRQEKSAEANGRKTRSASEGDVHDNLANGHATNEQKSSPAVQIAAETQNDGAVEDAKATNEQTTPQEAITPGSEQATLPPSPTRQSKHYSKKLDKQKSQTNPGYESVHENKSSPSSPHPLHSTSSGPQPRACQSTSSISSPRSCKSTSSGAPRADSFHKSPKPSLSHLQRFNAFMRSSLSRGSSLQSPDTENPRATLRKRHRKRKIPSRTTWMMFVLTAIFVISYLPYLTISGVRGVSKDVEVGLTGWRLNLYTIALRSYFINSVVNPIVYSFCSARFRHQCRHLLTRRGTLSTSE